ncbi:MAG: histidine--tRNA ligase [Candidatus Omnitrophica bacterium]|nr:histidine--tRNA ligase [Candidatus Omnitrophota bacterium]
MIFPKELPVQIKALRGTRDILPEECLRWQWLEGAARAIFRTYAYDEIRMPLLEDLAVFTRAVGETTEIVQKQMYTFRDRGDRDVCLRPEATASVVRAYLENGLTAAGRQKLYYLGPMFRAERPQAGRQRQFHQVGVENIGPSSPYVDAEVILLACRFLEALGIQGYRVLLSTLGEAGERSHVAARLREHLEPGLDRLSETTRATAEQNIFRLLDSKDPDARELTRSCPGVIEFLSEQSRTRFESVRKILDQNGVRYEVDPYLVRGLDYYSHTVFEITHSALGAQDALGAGGRYDGLIAQLGGPETEAVGFAMGVERLFLAAEAETSLTDAGRFLVFVVAADESAVPKAFEWVQALRSDGIPADWDCTGKNLKAQMKQANRRNASWVLILGERELSGNSLTVKDMATGEQESMDADRILGWAKAQFADE